MVGVFLTQVIDVEIKILKRRSIFEEILHTITHDVSLDNNHLCIWKIN